MDGIRRAGVLTVAIAEAAVRAGPFALEENIRCRAVVDAGVLVLVLGRFTVAVALDVSDHLYNVLRFDAHNFGDRSGGAVGAGDAEVGFRFLAFGERLGVAVAAGVAARAAVGAGQTFADRGEHLILGNAHVLGSDNEDQRGHRADDEQNNNGTYNSRHVTFLP